MKQTAREKILEQITPLLVDTMREPGGPAYGEILERVQKWNGETPLLLFCWPGGAFQFQLGAPVGTGGALAHRDRRIGWVGRDMARGNAGKCYVVTLTEGVTEVPLQDLLPTIREYHTDKTPLASQGL